jgi:uncharacterized cupin superfamily protein
MNEAQDAFSTSSEPTDYEPFIVNGQHTGDVHWLRDEGNDGVQTGIWRVQPGQPPAGELSEFVFHRDETIHVLEGRVEIEVDGERLDLRAGDVASFRRGAQTRWRVHAPFREFFIYS